MFRMTTIDSRFTDVAWEFLLGCIYLAGNGAVIEERDREIILTSPWISDLDNPNFKPKSMLIQSVEIDSKKRLGRLSEVLKVLVQYGYEVKVVTSKPGCFKWKSNWDDSEVSKDGDLQRKLVSHGVKVIHNKENHSKAISTPIGVILGSANLTGNGFFKNSEIMQLVNRNEANFSQTRNIVHRKAIPIE